MKKHWKAWCSIIICLFGMSLASWAYASAPEAAHGDVPEFPRSLESYHDADMESIGAILKNRIKQEPFNLVATLIFLCAIIHTFLTTKFLAYAHKWEHEHMRTRYSRGWPINTPCIYRPVSFISSVKWKWCSASG